MIPSPETPENPADDLLETIITDLGALAAPSSHPAEVDLSSLTAELESLTSTAEQRAIAQNQALQEQISQITAELTSVQAERDQLTQEVSRLQAAQEALLAQVQQLEAQGAASAPTVDTAALEAEIAQLTAEKATLEGMRQNLEQELAQSMLQQEELQQQLLARQREAAHLAELEAQLSTLAMEKAALEQQLQEALAAAPSETLEETALLSEPHDIGLAQQLAELTRQLTQVETERDVLKSQLEAAKQEADTLLQDNALLRSQTTTVVPTELTLAAQENRQLKRQQRRQGNVLWISGIAATVISALSVSLNLPQPVGRVVPPLATLAVPLLTTVLGGRGTATASAENPS